MLVLEAVLQEWLVVVLFVEQGEPTLFVRHAMPRIRANTVQWQGRGCGSRGA